MYDIFAPREVVQILKIATLQAWRGDNALNAIHLEQYVQLRLWIYVLYCAPRVARTP